MQLSTDVKLSLNTGSVQETQHYYRLEDLTDTFGVATLVNNNGTTFSAGKHNNAASFSAASSQSVSTASAISLHPDFSVTFWYNATASSQANAALIYCGSTWSNAIQFVIYRTGVNNLLARVGDNVAGMEVIKGAGWGTGAWVFVVSTYSSTTRQVTLDINETGDVTATALGNPRRGGPDVFRIGSNGGAYANGNYDGLIDEVAIWNKVLSSADRTTLYNGGAGTFF